MVNVRHMARQRALQLLYALEFADPEDEDFTLVERRFLNLSPSHRRGWGPFARELTRAANEQRHELDEAIEPMLRGWRLDRLPPVELICLRLALCELRRFPDIPLRVTINEYIELTRQFSGEEATQYVNAVLDRLAAQFPHKDFKTGPGGPTTAEPSQPDEAPPDERPDKPD